MRQWSLDQLSVLGVRPAELVEIAARAGYDAVSPFVGLGDNGGLPGVPLRAGDPDTLAMSRALRDTGLRLNQADGFAISPHFDLEEARSAVELVADMGARNVVALLFDADEARGFDQLAALSEIAGGAGIGLAIEFTPLSYLPSLAATRSLIERLGGGHVGMLVDLLHLAQSGEMPADIAALPPAMLHGAQLCDAPRDLDMDAYRHVAIRERMLPGTGELPVRDFLAAIPFDVIVGLEIPLAEPTDLDERAAMLIAAAKRAQEQTTED